MKNITKGMTLTSKNTKDQSKVLAVCDGLYAMSYSSDHDDIARWYTDKQIEKYFDIPEEKWVPKDRGTYFVPGITAPELFTQSYWANDDTDKHRLKHNLVFKTKEEAIARAREMLGMEGNENEK